MQEVQNSADCAQVTGGALLECPGAGRWKRTLALAVAHRADSTAGLSTFSGREGIQTEAALYLLAVLTYSLYLPEYSVRVMVLAKLAI